jgi:MFS family permease
MRWRELFQEGRGKLTAGILLVEFMVAIEALVVTAIMPAIKRDLGGLEFYGLVFTGFSLAALVASPIAGRAADRRGPGQPFLLFTGLFIAGTLLSGLATSMPLLALMRVLQGFGAGGAYTVSLVAVARTYPEAGRARVLALLAGAWIVPGLLGPSYGALVASTIGWRWAFFSIVPLTLAAAALALPALRGLPHAETSSAHVPLRWPIQLGAGISAVMVALSLISWATLPLIVIGLVVALPALKRILPDGSFRAKRGMPTATISIFLLLLAFIIGDYFIPLLVTAVRHRSLAEAGIVITLGTVSWSLGSWWQSRVVVRVPRPRLVATGATLVAIALTAMLATIAGAPLALPYLGWLVAGIGMGIAYPTLYMVVMESARQGSEGQAVGSAEVGERLGLALGGGLGGACIAAAAAAHAPLSAGLGGALALALAGALASIGLAPRLTIEPVLDVRFPLA